MIKLKDLLNLNSIKWCDTIKPEHQKLMNQEIKIIGKVIVLPKPFPENSSKETRLELDWLVKHNEGKIDKEFSKSGDNVDKVFKDYLDDNNLNYNKKYYRTIQEETKKFILELKYLYNRPRPEQLAEFYDIPDFKIQDFKTAQTPSYPSGHSIQAYLMADLLSREYPSHYSEFIKLADFVSDTRLMARIHYPSDCEFGKEVAKYIATTIK